VDEDRYGGDVLSGDWRSRGVKKVRQVPLERDMVLEDSASGWAGAATRSSSTRRRAGCLGRVLVVSCRGL
jgi:hypothetical protein